MNYLVLTKNEALRESARQGFHPADRVEFVDGWRESLGNFAEYDLVFLDMLITLTEPNRIAGYEQFAQAKMAHGTASKVPLVLISPEPDYELDYIVGWPGFVYGHLQQPLDYRSFRRASTWV